MNDVQKYLLNLVKEIDEICKKNDIEYYIFAGSMLGVERNEGFLPWDDDMDIVMTRKNYEKFRNVVAKQLPPNRAFEEKAVHKEYPLTFGKYTSTNTANMIRSLSYGNCAAGLWIDIMHLAPMPTNAIKRRFVRNIFPVYCELDNELYIEHPYRWKGFYRRYKALKFLSKLLGKQNVLHFIKRKLDAISEEKCKDYFLFHALDADFRVFSKECFGAPIRKTYEDIEVNVSPKNRMLCREAYGDGWMIIPNVENQDVHSTITDCEMPYTVYKRDFMQFLNSNQVLRDYNDTKQIHIEWQYKKKGVVNSVIKLECELIAMQTEKHIVEYGASLNELIEEKKYKEIGEIFSEYIEFQWSARVKNNDMFVPISDKSLFALVIYLIAEKQEFYSANKLLKLRQMCGGEIPKYFKEIEALIIELRKLSVALWDEEDYYKAYEICENNKLIWKKYSVKDFSHAFCIASLKTGINSESLVMDICQELLSSGDLSGVPDKLIGDIYIKNDCLDQAINYYSSATEKLRNGLLLLDVNKAMKGVLDDR